VRREGVAGFVSRVRLLLLAGSALGFAAPQTAQAQAAPAPPSREELNVGRPAQPTTSPSRLTVEGGLERGPCPLAEPAFANVRVKFASVDFSGLPGVAPEALAPAWRDMAGRDLPIASLCEVRDRASTILRDLGFLVAVQIPPQRVEAGGVVKMDVLAAKVVEIQLRGQVGPSEKLIAAQLEKLKERPWFNVHEAERDLLLLQDLPGYDVRLTRRSAERNPGEVIGDVQVVRHPVELVVGAQNLGSNATGPTGAFVELALNDLIGRGDRTTFSYYNTVDWSEQRIFRASHELALNADGLRFGGSVLVGRTRPSVAGGAFHSNTLSGELHLTDALVRRQASSLFATGGLEVANQQLYFGKTELSDDRLRVLYARLEHQAIDPDSIRGIGGYTIREPRWHTDVSLELRQGIDVLDASHDCSNVADCLPPNVGISNVRADPTAFVARLHANAEFRPMPHFTIAIAPVLQLASNALLPYEQISFGNYTIGRGLDPGIVQGDGGFGSSLELRYGSLLPQKRDGLAFEPFVFVDYATAWLKDRGLAPRPRDVMTAGAGVRGRWGDHFDFGATLAAPLKRAGYQAHKGDVRLLFTLTARVLPWGER
jgi:hemolysin activation/secretion protein